MGLNYSRYKRVCIDGTVSVKTKKVRLSYFRYESVKNGKKSDLRSFLVGQDTEISAY